MTKRDIQALANLNQALSLIREAQSLLSQEAEVLYDTKDNMRGNIRCDAAVDLRKYYTSHLESKVDYLNKALKK